MPKLKYENVIMIWDSDNSLAANGTYPVGNENIILKGDQIYLDYREVLDDEMKQEMISWYPDGRSSEEYGYYNVNPFNVFMGEGQVKLSPGSDFWHDTRRLPDNVIDGGTIRNIIDGGIIPRTVNANFQLAVSGTQSFPTTAQQFTVCSRKWK